MARPATQYRMVEGVPTDVTREMEEAHEAEKAAKLAAVEAEALATAKAIANAAYTAKLDRMAVARWKRNHPWRVRLAALRAWWRSSAWWNR